MKSLAELEAIKNKIKNQVDVRKDTDEDTIRIVVGMATCGIAAGARPVLSALVDEVGKRGLSHVTVAQTGCIGMCRLEPIVEVLEPGKDRVTYVKMTEEKAKKVIAEHIVNGNVVTEYTIGAAEK
ncbi:MULTISPECIES: (2Fe-2S) ferredoxin domain-containing protein [Congzhengia]|jgi:NADP-reducing hydrogenase subunit HndB|uniref:(2Fe-2S) ferredoxin domain-containing protein n=1 Tax=Congzhengia minquanensis TaxID=2763657 RepID=A0A926DKF2_9FIRM|nr:(2Fe-2S) ferredoxin domain-containing protein [Congzhengia minquanensis]MBC8539471.1 (2Fe-2S) ferredoxin domain-containing protein [Congzhengia minquanensis]MBD8946342.1 (2Fe-2S) ferredoxin domain-containing protein [Clostridiales bacterium]HBL82393.1 ferredoxin [Clostridiales bacterium]